MQIDEINKCIINLPYRTDRREQILKELPYLFSDGQAHFIDGIEHKETKIGIATAHLKCVQLAQDNNWLHVLIMEDDCMFQGRDRTREYVSAALQNIPEDWDILLGGIYSTKGLSPANGYWNRTSEFSGLHFYIVNQNAYDRILAYDSKFHIDKFMNYKNDLNCYVTKKFFATQAPGYSDNVKKSPDYSKMLKKFQLL